MSKQIVIAGQMAICWAAYSPRFNSIALFDAGVSNVTLLDPTSGDVTAVAALDVAGKGAVDAKFDRTFLYILRNAPFVTVLDARGLTHGKVPTEIQSFDLSSLGPRTGFQGMAIYPAS